MSLTKFPNGVGTDNDGVLETTITDISTGASSFTSALPYNVEITGAEVVQETAVTGADAEVTFEIAGTPITAMAATIAIAGGADGDAFSAVAPTGANSLAAGTSVEVITDGASTTASLGRVAISYKRVA
jgi:hypothetical protein